jgi:hypothetical protein
MTLLFALQFVVYSKSIRFFALLFDALTGNLKLDLQKSESTVERILAPIYQ